MEKTTKAPEELLLGDVSTEVKEKVFTIADEVFKILTELSLENKTEINSKQIAERMFYKEALKGLLSDIRTITDENEIEGGCLKELSNMLMDKFSELIPSYVSRMLGELKDDLHNKTLDGGSQEWIDSPLQVVKGYIDSISIRNNELEDFLSKSTEQMSTTQENMSRELSLQQEKFNDHIDFEKNISSDMSDIKQDLSGSGDFNDIKATVVMKIDELCARMDEKRKQDMEHIRATEKTLEEMSRQMSEMKREAAEVRKQSKAIQYDSSHDALTGVHNRKAYEKKMAEVQADVTRYGTTASLMVCDIDHFMNINDQWGHKVGDLSLKKLAALINDWMRTNDFVGRYGGGKFAIILPHTDRAGALIAGERLRTHIDNAKFSYKGETVPLTISIGIGCFRKDDEIHAIFERADNALHLAKESGRNRLEAEEEMV
jgi:diguanylate cyclase